MKAIGLASLVLAFSLGGCAEEPPAPTRSYILSCEYDGRTKDYRFDADSVDYYEQTWTGRANWKTVFVYKQVRVGEVCGTYIIPKEKQ